MNQDYTDKSRSQKKRESTAMQDLGERLAALPLATLERFGLPPALFAALRAWRDMKTHEARRRQMQYIGRMMREEGDEAAIRERLDEALAPGREEKAELHRLEELRDKLLAADDAELAALLQALAARHPGLELPRLRHSITQARAERAKGKASAPARRAFRELFRLLKTSNSQV